MIVHDIEVIFKGKDDYTKFPGKYLHSIAYKISIRLL